ncbi:hypothetical protein DSCO28_70680 [Desulfosarcina ovata subsp. sediminis]|uniref:Prepilin type IV endopeptidase peptidase domain-containing protein n=1 Tax=Desulfosarcina ovata subsp. sediminis TaxID=885957 RepID=A0A5K8A1S8_9BACT|nr:prepilin peptidase [Desulfosarcina ovata]BBO86502.1 hypothetical protein DSCO28_70680 [Desulfosarcina ovata subsp. sediminis]
MQVLTSVSVPLACMALLAAAVYTDLTRRLIPNDLIVAGFIGALVYHLLAASSPSQGVALAMGGLLTGGVLLFFPYRRSWTGAGDVKLLAVLGAWLGPAAILRVFIGATLIGGVMAAVQLFRYRRPVRRLCCPDGVALSAPDLPYALAIGGGYLLFLAWGNLL